ncbi:MAG: hypothetical protein GX022_02825 [Clostridiaceae bacterium]|nr:hypothetical protein [Clostridiaceae bacterium]
MEDMEKQKKKILEQKLNTQSEKPGGCLHSIIVVFVALLVVAVVFSGVFYFAVKNNISGLADSLKPYIKDYPILKIFMPQDLSGYDPEDPKYLSDKELVEKYQEYREMVLSLKEELDEAKRTIEEMEAEKQVSADIETKAEENRQLLKTIENEKAELEALKKSIVELIARGDPEGFKNYFQKIDKATAQAVYTEIMKEAVISEEKKALAKPFALMNPQGAANVLAEMYSKDKEAVLDIFEGMDSKAMAPILEKMEPKTAADIYGLLSDRRIGR